VSRRHPFDSVLLISRTSEIEVRSPSFLETIRQLLATRSLRNSTSARQRLRLWHPFVPAVLC
jgi:hypothetical protein